MQRTAVSDAKIETTCIAFSDKALSRYRSVRSFQIMLLLGLK